MRRRPVVRAIAIIILARGSRLTWHQGEAMRCIETVRGRAIYLQPPKDPVLSVGELYKGGSIKPVIASYFAPLVRVIDPSPC